jgi:hypothetical protein
MDDKAYEDMTDEERLALWDARIKAAIDVGISGYTLATLRKHRATAERRLHHNGNGGK